MGFYWDQLFVLSLILFASHQIEFGLFAVNLYQFFINNYGRPYWLWIAEFLNCLFDRAETESSMRNNLKNQLQQTVVFLPHIGLYYLKKKDKKETL